MTKNLLLLNSDYEATVNVDPTYIAVTLHGYGCTFTPVQNGKPETSYVDSVLDPTMRVEYMADGQTLSFLFDKKALDLSGLDSRNTSFTGMIAAKIEGSVLIADFHQAMISRPLEDIARRNGLVKVVSLTHSSATVQLALSSGAQLRIHTLPYIAPGNRTSLKMRCEPTLLTDRLFDGYVYSKRSFSMESVLTDIAKTADFQIQLNTVFAEYADRSAQNYIPRTYRVG
ncbi:MAG: hypothetical protein V2I33_17970 [Kangiellaceae bacterium]|jgi:hypothetical protein|nr:hypothetical protein [Kangiellaceae bacterium]